MHAESQPNFNRVVRPTAVALDLSKGMLPGLVEIHPVRKPLQTIELSMPDDVRSIPLPELLGLVRSERKLTPQQLLQIHEIAITRLSSDHEASGVALELSRAAMESAVGLGTV